MDVDPMADLRVKVQGLLQRVQTLEREVRAATKDAAEAVAEVRRLRTPSDPVE